MRWETGGVGEDPIGAWSGDVGGDGRGGEAAWEGEVGGESLLSSTRG